MLNKVYLMDCMEFMKTKSDNFYDLAVVDPPYGINCGDQRRQKSRTKLAKTTDYHYSGWDKEIPSVEYFNELFRISVNQIIFGGNYFLEYLKNTSCFIVWDKNNTGHFADCELAWTSFKTSVRKFTYTWNGMIQGNMKNKEYRIHPTQKPIAIYKWILKNYAKPGYKIIDTHVGSRSSGIACYDLGFYYEGCEKDNQHWSDQENRFNNHKHQDLFQGEQ